MEYMHIIIAYHLQYEYGQQMVVQGVIIKHKSLIHILADWNMLLQYNLHSTRCR